MTTLTTILILIFVLVIAAFIGDASRRRKFDEHYLSFLNQHDGLEIFCYTNREKFCGVIESELIPKLDKQVHIVKLIGKDPQTELDKTYISHALCNIKEVGFPNVMKVVNGRMVDLSMHKAIYDAINNKRVDALPMLVESKLKELRELE